MPKNMYDIHLPKQGLDQAKIIPLCKEALRMKRRTENMLS